MRSFFQAFNVIIITFTLSACVSTTQKSQHHVGVINQQQLLSTFNHFNASYRSYELSIQQKALLADLPDDLVVDVYFGTWCHDSVREVPRLLKVFEANPNIIVNLYGLNYQKRDIDGRAEKVGVKFTPTIIVSQNDKELGRIIERPKENLVSDILGFIK